MVEQVRTVVMAARIAAGLPIPSDEAHPDERPDPFWYARRSPPSLYWQRFRLHLTPSSVYFQGALRIAVALAAARAIAGSLNLEHGFWVLLATLTIMRTSAADTRTTLRPALVGTLAGAAVSGLLLVLAHGPELYVPLLPVAMVLAFAAGPLLGLAWAQAMITVLLTLVFAQLAPASLQLAGARVVDVVVGAGVGILAGLLFWPHGGSGQLRQDVAAYLEDHSERHDPRMSYVDWQAAVGAGNQMVRGAESLLGHIPPGRLAAWPGAATPLASFARRLRFAYADLATQLCAGRITRPVGTPSAPEDLVGHVQAIINAGEHRPEVLHLVEVEVWLASLSDDLARIQTPADQPAQHATR
jgi:hypothetical protein